MIYYTMAISTRGIPSTTISLIKFRFFNFFTLLAVKIEVGFGFALHISTDHQFGRIILVQNVN